MPERARQLALAFRAAEGELDPVKRAALFIRMNDLLHAPGSGWDNDLWNLKDWYRDA